jgi:hypothetical protein
MVSQEGREAQRENGRKAFEEGTGIHGATDEQRSSYGRLGGLAHVESGHIQVLGYIQGAKNVDSGLLGRIRPEQTHERAVEMGNKAFEKKAGFHGLTPEEKSDNARLGGQIAGRIAADTGRVHTMRTHEGSVLGGRTASHVRWHIKRHIINPRCDLCCMDEAE